MSNNIKPHISRNFIKDVIDELKRVDWPSRKKTIRLTTIVILISLIIGLYIGIIDISLAKVLEVVAKFR